MATRKKQDDGGQALLTTTAQIIGSTLGKIAVRMGLDGPSKASPRGTKVAAKENVRAKPKKATSKRVTPSTAKHVKSAPRTRKKS